MPTLATVAAIAVTSTLAVGAPDAQAAPAAVEVLRLECSARVTDTAAAVLCEWSTPTAAEVAGLRLWRLDPAVDDHRQVVFRTDDTTVTAHTDTDARLGHRYTYAIQALTADGRVVAQSRPDTVGVPTGVEALRLRCALTPAHDAVECRWSPPLDPDAVVVELWRSVDGNARELVASFRPAGPNAYRDPVRTGATRVTYAVLARDEHGDIVARSRAVHVGIISPIAVAATQAETVAP